MMIRSRGNFGAVYIALSIILLTVYFAAETRAQTTLSVDPRIIQDIQQKGSARVIVQTRQTGSVTLTTASQYLSQTLAGTAATVKAITPIGDQAAVIRADQEIITKLVKSPDVTSVIRDDALPPALEDVASVIGVKGAWSAGSNGMGVAIAVIDTGVDKAHPMLAGKVADEACFSVTDPASHSTSLCRAGADIGNGDWADTSVAAGLNCSTNISGCNHGTHVAGLAVGTEVHDGTNIISGIAPGASILSIQAYSRFDRSEDCQDLPTPCALSFISSQLRTLRYVYSRVLDHLATGRGPRIVGINMSLGGGDFGANCDSKYPVYARQIQALRQDGVAVFVAAGNAGHIDGKAYDFASGEINML